MIIKLYTKHNCRLCDDAKTQVELALESFSDVHCVAINIEGDPVLEERYMLEVPVVVHNGNIIQQGNVDFVTVFDYVKNL